MPGRALIEHRPWLFAGLALATAFWVVSGGPLGGTYQIALKGGSVAALAAYALARTIVPDGRMIAGVMGLGAAGDVAIELSTVAGGAFFLLSHLVAITLYLSNRREAPTASQRLAAGALVAGVPLGAWLLTRDALTVVYATALGAMAATAWLSRFSRYRVGVGALLFVISDLLIFARLGEVLEPSLTGWFIWPLYYAGQLLICTGVVQALRRDRRT